MSRSNRNRTVFRVLESVACSAHHRALSQSELQLAGQIFRNLCGGQVHNTHLSARELATSCNQPYTRARRLLSRFNRRGKQASLDEFVQFFGTVPPPARRSLALLFGDPKPKVVRMGELPPPPTPQKIPEPTELVESRRVGQKHTTSGEDGSVAEKQPPGASGCCTLQ